MHKGPFPEDRVLTANTFLQGRLVIGGSRFFCLVQLSHQPRGWVKIRISLQIFFGIMTWLHIVREVCFFLTYYFICLSFHNEDASRTAWMSNLDYFIHLQQLRIHNGKELHKFNSFVIRFIRAQLCRSEKGTMTIFHNSLFISWFTNFHKYQKEQKY